MFGCIIDVNLIEKRAKSSESRLQSTQIKTILQEYTVRYTNVEWNH